MTVTPLHEVHLALGATLTEFAGWTMPLRYTSESAEHRAVRTTAGLFDLSHMGQLDVVGPDAARALDHALVGHLSAVGIGRARYTMVCRPDGGVLDDLVVYRLADEHFLVIANAANTAAVTAALVERTGGSRALVTAATDRALIAVQGPAAPAILQQVTDVDVASLRYYAVDPARIGGAEVLLARTGYTGEDGFEVFCTAADAPELWSQLSAAGAPHGLVPAGLSCRDTLRLEAGMPLYGHELTVDHTPYDAGFGRVVKFDKPGGFVGDLALLQFSRSGVGVSLVGLALPGRRVPRPGYPVLDPTSEQSVGHITSGAPSPTLGHPIAMAYLAAEHAAVGSEVVVDIRGRHEPASVVALPFYRRPR